MYGRPGELKTGAVLKAAKKAGLKVKRVRVRRLEKEDLLGLPSAPPDPLVAVAFGKDDLPEPMGDSAFYPGDPNAVPFKEGDTFTALNRRFRKAVPRTELEDPVAGFWVVRQSVLKDALEIWDDVDPGGDSAMYMCNYAVKRRLARRAERTVLK